jgi:general secretion pathway protein K
MTRRTRHVGRGTRRGVALMLVLWLVIFLGSVAASVAASARAEAALVGNVKARATARYAAESGVSVATARLGRLLARARGLDEQVRAYRQAEEELAGARDLTLGTGAFAVAIVDLNARLDLNYADEATFRAFFGQFTSAAGANAIVDALADWKDADDLRHANGAEAADYARAGSPFRPTNHPLRRLDELTRIAGFTDSLASAIAPYVTVSGDGRINVNTAPERVLSAIPRLGRDGARLILSWRAGGEVFGTTADLFAAFQRAHLSQSIAMWTLQTTSTRWLVVSRGWTPGQPLTHEVQAVYDLTGGQLVLRGWTERDL